MRHHLTDEKAAANTSHAIYLLALGTSSGARKMCDGLGAVGACEIVVRAQQTHTRSEAVALSTSRAIIALAQTSEQNRRDIGLAGGCASIVQTLRDHRNAR